MFFIISVGVCLVTYVVIDGIQTAALINSISESTIAALKSISIEEEIAEGEDHYEL